tara:strand:+ start:8234 stop:8467 length:234 start_codon:yes stop_codon:yes gene_type:complete
MIYVGDSEHPWELPVEQINLRRRNEALQETDWTQTLDAPLSDGLRATYQEYRQALRDITQHENWPLLDENDWPTLEV